MRIRTVLIVLLIATFSALSRAGAQSADGQALYDKYCEKCHGVRGIPSKNTTKKYEKVATFDAAFIKTHSDDSIVKILNTGKGEIMKKFKDKLTAEEMAAVAKYVRELGMKSEP